MGIELLCVTTPLIPPFDRRKDKECQAYFRRVTKSTLFQVVMIATVTANSFLLVLGTDYNLQFRLFRIFEVSRKQLLFYYFACIVSENVKLFERHLCCKKFSTETLLKTFDLCSSIS